MAEVVAQAGQTADVHVVDVDHALDARTDAPHVVEDLADRHAVGEVVVRVQAVLARQAVREGPQGRSVHPARGDAVKQLDNLEFAVLDRESQDVCVDVQDVDVLGLYFLDLLLLDDIEQLHAAKLARFLECLHIGHIFSHVVLGRKLEVVQQVDVRVEKLFLPKKV